MASALLQGARQRVEQDLVSVANTVRLGPTQCLGGLWEAWWEGSVQRQRGTPSVARGICTKHGAYGFCSVGGCSSAALSTTKGTCTKHGGSRSKVCKTEGCTTLA